MKPAWILFAVFVLPAFLVSAAMAQTTIAELNGNSSLATFGAFSDPGVIDVSSGDIEIDVSDFGGNGVGVGTSRLFKCRYGHRS